jgi:hypothetical protein
MRLDPRLYDETEAVTKQIEVPLEVGPKLARTHG